MTDASRGGDDKPQATFVPLLPAPRCLSRLWVRAPLPYLRGAGVKSSRQRDCRRPGWQLPDKPKFLWKSWPGLGSDERRGPGPFHTVQLDSKPDETEQLGDIRDM